MKRFCSDEVANSSHDFTDQGRGEKVPEISHQFEQIILSEHLLVRVERFGHPIGVKENLIARFEVDFRLFITLVFDDLEWQSSDIVEHGHLAGGGSTKQRGVVPRGGVPEFVILHVQNPIEPRLELVCRNMFGKDIVDDGERAARTQELLHEGAHYDASDRHHH